VLEEEQEETYFLSSETEKKYSISKEQELIAALTAPIKSIDHLPTYSEEQDQDYHSLPDLDIYTEQGKLIT
jgi:hypothetical protein